MDRISRKSKWASRSAVVVWILAGLVAGACQGSSAAAPEAGPHGSLVYGRGPDGARDLFVVPAGGGEPTRLTRHPASDGLPRWSADGRSVLFASNRSGGWQLWRVPAAGGEPTRVRSNDHTEWQADESPDGRLADTPADIAEAFDQSGDGVGGRKHEQPLHREPTDLLVGVRQIIEDGGALGIRRRAHWPVRNRPTRSSSSIR